MMMVGLQTGDMIVVKPGTRDPDFEIDIGDWQGRIEEINDGGAVLIRWDSITLRQMGLELAIQCENENLDWELMTLETTEIEKTSSRDTKADVRNTANVLRDEVMDDPRLDAKLIRIR